MPERRVRLPAEERRERILETAVDVFAEHGYRASTGELAAAAGLTRTVLYHYFPSKEQLYLAVLEAQAAALVAHLAPHVAGEGTQQERARRTIDALLDFHETRPSAWQILFDPRDDGEPEVVAAHRRVHELTMQAGRHMFAPDMAEAGLDADSPRTAVLGEMQLAAVIAAARWWRDHPSVPRQQVATAAFDLLWHGIAGLPERGAAG